MLHCFLKIILLELLCQVHQRRVELYLTVSVFKRPGILWNNYWHKTSHFEILSSWSLRYSSLLHNTYSIFDKQRTNGFYFETPFFSTLFLHSLNYLLFFTNIIRKVGENDSVDEHSSVNVLENVLLFDKSKDKGYISDEVFISILLL